MQTKHERHDALLMVECGTSAVLCDFTKGESLAMKYLTIYPLDFRGGGILAVACEWYPEGAE